MPRPITSRALTAKVKLLILLSSLLAVGVVAAGAHRWLSRTNASAGPPVPPVAQQEDVDKVVLLAVRPTGFDPAEATLPAGKYLLVVQNRSGLHEVTLRMEAESGHRMLEARIPAGRSDWRKRLKLAPGNYTLTEANNPEWVCRLSVTP